MKRTPIILLALPILLFSAYALYTVSIGKNEPLQLNYRDAATVSLGQRVYADHCAVCHGENLQGEPNWRTRDQDGFLPAPPHDRTGHTWHHDAEVLFQLTKYGVAQFIGNPDYPSMMPAFEGILSDDEIIAVLSYIKSEWPQDVRDRHSELEAQK